MTKQMPPARSPTTLPPQSEETRQVSVAQQIADLDVGESYSQVKRIDGDQATKEAIKAVQDAQDNTLNAAVARAKKKSGATYRKESGLVFTRSLDVLVVIAVTRVA